MKLSGPLSDRPLSISLARRPEVVWMTLAALIGTVLVTGLTDSAASADPNCPSVVVLAVRGSGEVPKGPLAVTLDPANYDQGTLTSTVGREMRGVGDKLQLLLSGQAVSYPDNGDQVIEHLGSGLVDMLDTQAGGSIQVEPLIYPGADTSLLGSISLSASSPFVDLSDPAEYLASIEIGVVNLKNSLAAHTASCPEARFVLAGYSQGAMVIHRALADLGAAGSPLATTQKIGAVALLADPLRQGGGTGFHLGTAPASTGGIPMEGDKGLIMYLAGAVSYPDADIPSSLAAVTYSYCTADDLFCAPDFRVVVNQGISIHSGYSIADMTSLASSIKLTVVDQIQLQIPDPNLRSCLYDERRLDPAAVLRRGDVASIQLMFCFNVTDIGPLRYFRSLTILGLVGGIGVDLAPLAEMSQLREFTAHFVPLINPGYLASLTHLTTLGLYFSGVTDITPLVVMPELQYVNLAGNEITDLSPLQNALALKTLDMRYNSVHDLSPLAGHTSLTTLKVSFSDSTGLKSNIHDISALSGLTNLTTLDLGSNWFSDLTPLSGLTKLTDLRLSSSHSGVDTGGAMISDVSPLAGLTKLVTLDLNYNAVQSLAPISALPALSTLLLENNGLVDVSALDALPKLNRLDVANNLISDARQFTSFPQLYDLDLTSNQLIDASPLVWGNFSRLVLADQNVTLPDTAPNRASTLPTILTGGRAVTFSVAEFSSVSGTVSDGSIVWLGEGQGYVRWVSSILYGEGMLAPFTGYVSQTAASPGFFADVTDPASTFYPYIQWIFSSGISTGTVQPTGKPLYKPSDAVSRQAMSAFLYRLSGDAFSPPAEATFADVPTTSAFFEQIEWMASTGISTGTAQLTGKPLYKPTAAVSRQAMAAFLFRMSGDTFVAPAEATFADVPTTSALFKQIEWMAARGISTGTAQPTGKPLFKANDPVSRQAMAAFLHRYDALAD